MNKSVVVYLPEGFADWEGAFIMIGSDTWMDAAANQLALTKALEFLKRDILVAGICGATVALARVGAYENYKHTSNALEMINYFLPTYAGKEKYEDKMAVRDRNLITASGTGFLEFTLEIMNHLNIYTDQKRSQWYALYKNGVRPPMDFWNS